LVICLLALAAALPGSADAARAKKKAPKKTTPIVGVQDVNWPFLYDPNYLALGTKISRAVIPYDFYLHPADLDATTRWLNGARAAGIEPLVSLHHSNVNPAYLPTVAEFSESIRYLRQNFPWVTTISPWNEANHKTQPTVNNPKRAAQYFNATAKICRSCTIVAADVLDQKNMMPWLKKFLKYAKKPKIWGLHSYTDTNHAKPWRKSATRAFLKKVKGEVWLTEVGGIVAFKNTYFYDPVRAAGAIRRTLNLSLKDPRITRVYLYCWHGVMNSGASGFPFIWDSGFVDPDGTLRPGYNVLVDWLKAHPAALRAPSTVTQKRVRRVHRRR
jgi:hypothetical protein